MKLSQSQVRDELARIVGDRYVSIDPATLAGYSWKTGLGSVPPGMDKFESVWAVAVVLPATVEEVAEIVRFCNRQGLHFKAHSTGYGSTGNVGVPDAVAIDLRRMDTLEIDDENRMAVIGPYTTAGRLQAEAFKRGLTCHIVGAGPAHSPLASATSVFGIGVTSHFTSMNARNLLSWEWVSPKGDIVRGGSRGSELGWFSGDGPGPGLRGMIRGMNGAMGALGVFTKIGYKLYPVPFKGLAVNTGQHPQIGMAIPQHCRFYHVVWDAVEDQQRATFEILQADVVMAMLRMPPDHIGWTVTASNAEYVEKLQDGTLPEVARVENRFSWSLATGSRSAEEAAWRDRVLHDIVQRTGGRFLDLRVEDEEVLYRNLMTSHYIPRVFRPTGGISTTFGIVDSFQHLSKAISDAEEVIAHDSFAEDGKLVRGSPEEHWIWSHEGKYMWAENILAFDNEDVASREAAMKAFLTHVGVYLKKPAGTLPFGIGPIMDLMGGAIGRPQDLIRSIKAKLDPEGLSHSAAFPDAKVPRLMLTAMNLGRPFVFSRLGRKLLSRKLTKGGSGNFGQL